MSADRKTAWRSFVNLQNTMRARDGLAPFDANLSEYAPMLAGFYEGYRAAELMSCAEASE